VRAILMLHGVDPSGSVLSVAPRELESLLGSVLGSGHRVLGLPELLQGREPNAIALTFDDAFRSVHDAALPVLRSFAVTATVFVTTGYVGRDNGWPSQPKSARRDVLMGWAELEALRTHGWDLQAHSISHPDLRTLSRDALEDELATPKALLEERFGGTVDTLAYPYGYYDPAVAELASEHYARAVTTEFRPLSGADPAMRLPRLDAYYLRSPLVHGWFGNRRPFTGFLELRRALRKLRRHPGEITA
jgi:peptidoglycan/xylan/chitin deacetylase (PgdA/CDA1 family)